MVTGARCVIFVFPLFILCSNVKCCEVLCAWRNTISITGWSVSLYIWSITFFGLKLWACILDCYFQSDLLLELVLVEWSMVSCTSKTENVGTQQEIKTIVRRFEVLNILCYWPSDTPCRFCCQQQRMETYPVFEWRRRAGSCHAKSPA